LSQQLVEHKIGMRSHISYDINSVGSFGWQKRLKIYESEKDLMNYHLYDRWEEIWVGWILSFSNQATKSIFQIGRNNKKKNV